MSRTPFTSEEDARIWKFAISHEISSKRETIKKYMKESGSSRDLSTVLERFTDKLLPNLSNTKLHPEYKLKLCEQYGLPMSNDFLAELREHATVTLSKGLVSSFTMNADALPNTDLEDNSVFLDLVGLTPKTPEQFTNEDDDALWDYVIKNKESFSRFSRTFWSPLIDKMKWNRCGRTLNKRFARIATELHKKEFDIKTKLELYVVCETPVKPSYLLELEEYADIELDEKGRILKWAEKQRKRKANGGGGPAPKRMRNGDEDDEMRDVGETTAAVVNNELAPLFKMVKTIEGTLKEVSEGLSKKLEVKRDIQPVQKVPTKRSVLETLLAMSSNNLDLIEVRRSVEAEIQKLPDDDDEILTPSQIKKIVTTTMMFMD